MHARAKLTLLFAVHRDAAARDERLAGAAGGDARVREGFLQPDRALLALAVYSAVGPPAAPAEPAELADVVGRSQPHSAMSISIAWPSTENAPPEPPSLPSLPS